MRRCRVHGGLAVASVLWGGGVVSRVGKLGGFGLYIGRVYPALFLSVLLGGREKGMVGVWCKILPLSSSFLFHLSRYKWPSLCLFFFFFLLFFFSPHLTLPHTSQDNVKC